MKGKFYGFSLFHKIFEMSIWIVKAYRLTELTAYLPRGGEPEEGLPERCELLSAHVEDDHGLAADVVAAVRLLLRQDMAGSIFIIYTGSFSKVVLSQGAVNQVFLGLFH